MNDRMVLKSAVACLLGVLASPLALAAPEITQATSTSFEQGGTLTILGSGFVRDSPDPHAVMLDLADKAYINGEVNTYHENFEESEQILRIDEDSDSLWWKPSMGSTEALMAPSVVRSPEGRSFYDGALYSMKGYNTFLGWPSAYGGTETPTDNAKLYVSWYLKMSYDPRYYWTVSPQSQEGRFIPGEKITVNGHEGRFIGIGTEGHAEGMLHFEIEGVSKSVSSLTGERIVGEASGASTIFPNESAKGSGVGYEPPGANKFLRVWEDPRGVEGIRLSWTQMQVDREWVSTPITPSKWHFMEFMLDTESSELRTYTDRELVATVDLAANGQFAVKGKWSPTIALLGFNGKTQEFQGIKVDDIYMDKSFARVAVGNKPNFSELNGYELQYPVKWSAQEIQVKLNFGMINPKTQSYLYVIDENGNVNEEGYPLCEDCGVPPSKIKLDIN